MIRITGCYTKFDDLKVGDIFSLVEVVDMSMQTYFNIKVTPSLTIEYAEKGKDFAFNAVAFEDGRVRTFHPESHVYLFDKNKIF